MSKRIILSSILTGGAMIAPLLASAQTIGDLLGKIKTGVINPLIGLLFVTATLVFLWGVLNYVIGIYGDEKKLDEAKRTMAWGLIGLLVMSSAWGIVRLLCNFFVSCPNVFP